MFVVTGATGNVGRHVVRELAEAGAEVCALTRNPETARLPSGVRAARTEDLPFEGATALFLNPAVVWNGADALLRRATEQGVRRIVLLSSSAALDPGPGNPIGTHHRDLELAIEALGVEWTFVRPGAFAVNALQWADEIKSGDVVHGPYAECQTAPIHEADMGEVAARALLGDDLVGQAPVLTGPESLAFAEQARIVGEAIGRPLRYEELPREVVREGMIKGFATPEIADALLDVFAAGVGRPAEISAETERITGHPGRTFAQWAADHKADFS
ncbi:NAD(P)H-binding protein [Streptomyces coffeae]|uniref:NAD(P)H-binding protein n=1 Tax=Streptomyces coffeae TaxID=621382 RepID=A0ABS1NHD2_9ACTN|nr:NAD(P)H-binding protein [Streptomyces coffeae]MBL1099458.1 NAD(P)H-binding protein [Streptomyces coffeae]